MLLHNLSCAAGQYRQDHQDVHQRCQCRHCQGAYRGACSVVLECRFRIRAIRRIHVAPLAVLGVLSRRRISRRRIRVGPRGSVWPVDGPVLDRHWTSIADLLGGLARQSSFQARWPRDGYRGRGQPCWATVALEARGRNGRRRGTEGGFVF